MLEALTDRLQQIFKNLSRHGVLGEADVDSALREVRLALLEADVHFTVVKDFLARVRARAVGSEVSRALNPAQQVMKIVHEELAATLGPAAPWSPTGPKPRVVMLLGLQGSGKTTTAGKLAKLFRADGERVLLVAADVQRPAAVRQLQILGEQAGVSVYAVGGGTPPQICAAALEQARRESDTLVFLDTAGRQQIDEALMAELVSIKKETSPVECLLVADATTGQEAVHIAASFHKAIGLTGLILTKMDGDARGGAAISIRAVTGVPIRWIGTGEGPGALEAFDPERIAGRILGQGDMIGLIRRAEEAFSAEETRKQAGQILGGEFTLEDLLAQIRQIRKLGPLGQILDMLPGAGAGKITPQEQRDAEQDMKRKEAILCSMTSQERRQPGLLDASRRKRIARGSGTEVQEINRLIQQYRQARKMMKMLGKNGGRGIPGIFG
ncbi:MAG: signal recognition particle protein [Anaerolineales bacterium]|nr:signal recognition particle protein [Anaerolineales bacterium]